jgi:hypothetical protein
MQYGSSINNSSLIKVLERIPQGSITINDKIITYDKIDQSIEFEINSLLRKNVDLSSILKWLVITNNGFKLYILLKLSGYNPKNLNYQYKSDNGNTLLMMSCISNNINIAHILLFNHICDINLLNNNNKSAIDIATDPILKQLLINYGAKIPVVYNSSGEICAICHKVKTGSNRVAKVTLCGHTFHLGCIVEARKYSNLCPLCRGIINTIEVF